MLFFTYVVFMAYDAIKMAIGTNDMNYSYDDNTTNYHTDGTTTLDGECS